MKKMILMGGLLALSPFTNASDGPSVDETLEAIKSISTSCPISFSTTETKTVAGLYFSHREVQVTYLFKSYFLDFT